MRQSRRPGWQRSEMCSVCQRVSLSLNAMMPADLFVQQAVHTSLQRLSALSRRAWSPLPSSHPDCNVGRFTLLLFTVCTRGQCLLLGRNHNSSSVVRESSEYIHISYLKVPPHTEMCCSSAGGGNFLCAHLKSSVTCISITSQSDLSVCNLSFLFS